MKAARKLQGRRVQMLRETHETPEYVEQRLRSAGGINRYGEPMYRVVWGWNRLAWMGGKFTEKDRNGTLIREVVQLRLEPKYPAVNRWHVEKWLAPETYGSPRAWYSQTIERNDGQSVPALGPYPSRGEYEHVLTLEDARGEFLQLSPRIVERVARAVEYSVTFSPAERKAALQRRMAREEKEYDAYADMVLNDGPAFGKQPFVTVL
jgi:hypothetical protein